MYRNGSYANSSGYVTLLYVISEYSQNDSSLLQIKLNDNMQIRFLQYRLAKFHRKIFATIIVQKMKLRSSRSITFW